MIIAAAVLMGLQFLNVVLNVTGGVPAVGHGRYVDRSSPVGVGTRGAGSTVATRGSSRPRADLADHPMVSLLVPARDEAENIERCVRSLLAQRLVSFEVIVVDDGSTDGTGAIVERIAAADDRVRVLRSPGPPPGWTGKTFACNKLSMRAKGEWLVFVDADVELVPDAVAESIGIADRRGYDFVSGLPFSGGGTRSAVCLTSAMAPLVLLGAPLWLANGRAKRRVCMAMGQFMCFRREAYDAVGGHAAVRGSLIEDVSLSRELQRLRRPTGFLDLTHAAKANMFPTLTAAWKGFARWFQCLSGFSAAGLSVAITLAGVLYLLPWFAVGFGLHDLATGKGSALLAVGALGIATAAIADRVTKRAPWMTLLLPLAFCCYVLAFLVGLTRHLRHVPTRWRGREYDMSASAPTCASPR